MGREDEIEGTVSFLIPACRQAGVGRLLLLAETEL